MVLFKSQIGFYVRLKTFQRANINDAAVLVCRNHFFYYVKSRNGKIYPFSNVIWIGQIQSKLLERLATYGPALSYKFINKFALQMGFFFAFENGKKITFANGYLLPF